MAPIANPAPLASEKCPVVTYPMIELGLGTISDNCTNIILRHEFSMGTMN